MKTYYAYQEGSMEKFDSYRTNSRINAAKYFARKKQLELKQWLEINTVLEQDNFNIYYNKQLVFKFNSDIITYEVNKNNKFIYLINTTNNEILPKIIKYYKLGGFIKYMLKSNYSLNICEIPTKENLKYYDDVTY